MAKICLCLTGKTLAQDLEILNRNRKWVDIAELRVDCLDRDEWFHIRKFPEMAGLPVILTIRRSVDGGYYVGAEGARIILFAQGLAYAEADRRRNFAYVDLEEDLNVPSLEDAARTFGTRVIRSWHNQEGVGENLAGKIMSLRRVGDEIVKAAVMPRSLDDVVKVYRAAKETGNMEKILICMGDYGINTRILAEFLGSRISYTFPRGEENLAPATPGQMDPRELAELYRFHEITNKTKVYAVCGHPLESNITPRFFNTIFRMEQIDAVFVPIQADSVESFMHLAREIGISGIAVSDPYTETVVNFLSSESEEVAAIGACNTLVAGPQGWTGYNTDVAGFSASLLSFIGRKDLRRWKITIVGAGGAAKAVASEVHRLRGKALILNRTASRARELAELYKFVWAGLDSRGADLMEKYSNLIIQTSPVGMDPDSDADPIEFYKFSGKETFIDLICRPEKTLCLKRAEKAGCRVLNGYDMLHRQARHQYAYFMNKEFPPSLISRVRF
ncbi:MAG: type I 3-dehydroquinate dehydratase [Treponema sp.]|nr:type I 3-dehydroquinate dehydratase [Treponema sp.]